MSSLFPRRACFSQSRQVYITKTLYMFISRLSPPSLFLPPLCASRRKSHFSRSTNLKLNLINQLHALTDGVKNNLRYSIDSTSSTSEHAGTPNHLSPMNSSDFTFIHFGITATRMVRAARRIFLSVQLCVRQETGFALTEMCCSLRTRARQRELVASAGAITVAASRYRRRINLHAGHITLRAFSCTSRVIRVTAIKLELRFDP